LSSKLLVVGGPEIERLLAGREEEIVALVARAYLAHNEGKSSLPHSTFLRFPDDEVNRIIALPAFLGDGFDVAGLKWIRPGYPRRRARQARGRRGPRGGTRYPHRRVFLGAGGRLRLTRLSLPAR
jgi:ornithine cyclodeaminase/alanine dehydrogenase-like protein (mu-crystallin family)